MPTKKNSKKTSKWIDPIVEEIRSVRDSHARKFKYDLTAIFEDLKQYETEVKEKRSTKKPA